jgi:radical SAM superfamily enzyme YgiQ (UPF0313 family)
MPKLILINPSTQGFNTARQGIKLQPLSLAYVAALTPSNWEIKMYDETFEDVRIENDATLVGISALTSNVTRAYELAKIYRQKGIKVVLGGMHVSMMPDEAKKYCDSVVVGEAENIWGKVLADALCNNLKPIYRGELPEFNTSIKPRRDLLSKKYTFASVQTSRGCPLDCEFCSVKAFSGSKFRQRDANDVLDEIQQIPQKYLFFTDDNLIGYSQTSRERAKKIFKGMIERKIKKKWFCQSSMNFADDEETLKLASESGCIMVFVGIESIEDHVLSGNMNKTINIRKGTEYYYKFINKVHKYRIIILGGMVFGSDEASDLEFENVSEFIEKSSLDIPWPGIITPYPGTRLHKRLNDENRIINTSYPKDWDKYNKSIVIIPKNMTPIKFYNKFTGFIYKNYSLTRIIIRAIKSLVYLKSISKSFFVYKFNRALVKRFNKSLVPPNI